MRSRLQFQKGISVIMVIVLIVLFGLLGTYMVSMSSLSSLGTTQSRSAMQVWFATRAGVEWAVHQSLAASDGGCGCAAACCSGIGGQTLNFSEGGLNGYSATVDSCSVQAYTESGSNYCVYKLDVSGTNNSGAQLTSVSRSLSLTITDRNAP